MKKAVKISLIIAAVVLAAIIAVHFALIGCGYFYSCEQLSMEICNDSWQEHITYDMLSEDIQGLISEEEFNDTSAEGRLKMYKKLNGVRFVEKEHFHGSTEHWKTPPYEDFIIDGQYYGIEFRIDIDMSRKKLFPKPEIVNFTTTISE